MAFIRTEDGYRHDESGLEIVRRGGLWGAYHEGKWVVMPRFKEPQAVLDRLSGKTKPKGPKGYREMVEYVLLNDDCGWQDEESRSGMIDFLASMISVHVLAEMFRKDEEQVASDIVDLHLKEQQS